MNESLARLGAIVRADVMIRLRRPSTAFMFVLISIIAYMWVPPLSSGRTLMQIGESRVFYDSAAIGMGTALIAALFVGLVGFYVVSNAIRRDVETRCGFVIASTSMRGREYLAGKFLGNVAFLSIFTAGFMLTAMGMVVVRGEAPLEPLVFAWQYFVLLPPTITFVSAIAIAFEATPLLRSKAGDVAYFFLWFGLMGGISAATAEGGVRAWAPYFDVSGMALVYEQILTDHGTGGFSIGSSRFEAANAPVIFSGLAARVDVLLPRLVATLWPLALLLPARVFFHRFDPARVRASRVGQTHGKLLGRLNALTKPVAWLFGRAGAVIPLIPSALARASFVDALATIGAFPLIALAIVGSTIVALASDGKGVLPIAFGACAVAIADIACRERRAGTIALVFATPRLRERFVLWKFGSALFVACAMLAVPVARAITLRPSSALALLVGVLFVAALATALGIVSANSKTFLVVFLTFWYVAMSDAGHTPALDFAGWSGAATPAVTAAYAAAAAGLLLVAVIAHARQLQTRS